MSKRRVIETVEQLAATPNGTIILDAAGDAMEKVNGEWYLGHETEGVVLPARVLMELWER